MAREQGPAPEIAPGSPFVGRREEMRQLGTIWNQDYRDFQRRYTGNSSSVYSVATASSIEHA